MSRLQKKKPLGDKKRKIAPEKEAAGAGVTGSAAKSAGSGAVSKPRPEKKIVEPVRENLFTRAAEFIREVKVELKKVTWPTRKQTTGTTIIVILFVFVVAAFLGVFDYSLSKLVQVVLT